MEHKTNISTLGFELTFLDTVHFHTQHVQGAAGHFLQTRDGTTGSGFAGTGFADQSQHFGTVNSEINTIDRLEIRLRQMPRIGDSQSLGLDGNGLVMPILAAFNHLALLITNDQFLPDTRHGREQPLGVIVFRRVEDLFDASLLDHMTSIHDHHFIGDIGDHTHIMSDNQHGSAEFVAGKTQQVKDFGLHSHVECGSRFVSQNQTWIEHQRHGDDDTLFLAARELMRIVVNSSFGIRNTYFFEDIHGLGTKLLLVFHAVSAKSLFDLPSDGIHRIKYRIRFLEHHGRF